MYFYPRSPCGERHSGYLDTRQLCAISIHALLAESDAIDKWDKNDFYKFLSTLSLRRATAPSHSPCLHNRISIHALLAESDGGGE